MKTAKLISRAMLRAHPETLFVFGDNLLKRGLGGQAKECRGEPNAIGIPTKRMPGMREIDFFTDDDFEIVRGPIKAAFDHLATHMALGGEVVWPEAGIGTGLAQLQKRAPKIWRLIEERKSALDNPTII